MRPIAFKNHCELAQGTPAWHLWRHDGVGGSDAPAVIGVSPYRSVREIFREKSKAEPRSNANSGKAYIYALGHSTEAKCRALLEKKLEADFPPACAEHESRGFLRASLDGLNENLGIFEAKLLSSSTLGSILRNQALPEHHYVQVQHSLAVTRMDRCFYMALDPRDQGLLVEVRANHDYIAKLESEEMRFWDKVLEQRGQSSSVAFFRNRLPDESAVGVSVLHSLRSGEFSS